MKRTSILTAVFVFLLTSTIVLSGCTSDGLTGPDLDAATFEQVETSTDDEENEYRDNDGSTTYHAGHNTTPEDG